MRSILIALLVAVALPAMAQTNYLIVAVRSDITTPDRVKIEAKLMSYFGMTLKQARYHVVWEKATAPFTEWKVKSITVDLGKIKRSGLTKTALDAWKEANLANPNRCQIVAAPRHPGKKLRSEGLRPIPSELP